MGLLLLTLLMTTYVKADSENSGMVVSIKNPINGKTKVEAKMLIDEIEKASTSSMLQFREKLSKHKETILEELTMTDEQKEDLEDSLESFKRLDVDEVDPKVHPVDEINTESGVANVLFQDDMILSKGQQDQIAADIGLSRFKRQACSDKACPEKWENGVTYTFDSELSKRARTAFRKAANLWMRYTCINFKEQEFQPEDDDDEEEDGDIGDGEEDEYYGDYREPGNWEYYDEETGGEEGDGLIIVNGENKCSSSVGKQPGGIQIGTAAHEIAHALGFWHIHARHDRDRYITINLTNVNATYISEFTRQRKAANDNYDLPYDYGSLMHYRATSASINGAPTMVPKDGKYTQTLGSLILGFYDVLMMNKLYQCTEKCKNYSTPCENYGFPHPRNCSRCICPSGYGGLFCEKRPPGCGSELYANDSWQLLENVPSEMQAGSQDGYKRCNYWIKAPSDRNGTIEVEIVNVPLGVAVDGCIYGGVEIKARTDQGLTGYRFCSKYDVGTTLKSKLNTVPVITFARRRRNITATVLKYRFKEEKKKEIEVRLDAPSVL